MDDDDGFRCQDCGGSNFYEGPHGGMAVNFCCADPQCRARYNDLVFAVDRHGQAEEDFRGFNRAQAWVPRCNVVRWSFNE